jgi:hypothetical protein
VEANGRPRYESTQLCPPDFSQRGQKYTMEKKQPLQKHFWENWLSAYRKLKPDPCLSPCTSINLKWINDLNIRPETLKLVQKRVGNTL